MSLRNLRNALIVMGAFLALIWILQVVNWADHYQLDQEYGILPRSVGRLGDIFTAPFLHANWQHIEGNSLPLFVLGVAAAYRSLWRFAALTVFVAITSGLTVWFFQSGSAVTIGASGIIFGYFGYVLVRGIVDRNWIDLLVGLLAGAAYYSILAVALPGTPGISWLAHIGGLVGGVAGAWLLRTPRSAVAPGSRQPAVAGAGPSAGPVATTRPYPSTRPSGSSRPSADTRPSAGSRPSGGSRPSAGPTPGGSQSAEDLLRDLKDMGF
jgi:membrane associated rhomboid family serine protease